jgi:uncharacterized DUF497 family protein
MRYEWDDEKNQENMRKHGMSLSAGISIFSDPYRIEAYDDRVSYGEDRFYTIGMDVETRTLYVCYTTRGEGDATRLISVRKAESYERRLYERQRQW